MNIMTNTEDWSQYLMEGVNISLLSVITHSALQFLSPHFGASDLKGNSQAYLEKLSLEQMLHANVKVQLSAVSYNTNCACHVDRHVLYWLSVE